MLPDIFNTGLNSNIWGPGAWIFLHSISLTYPNNPTENDKKMYKIFFDSLGYLLPCNECSNHYNDYLLKNPLTYEVLHNKETLTYWLYNLHNNVNHLLNKEKIEFNTFIENYKDMYLKKNIYDQYINIILLGLILIIIGIFIYKYKC
uniref:thiol oxidase n=1 Tax=viral metagenome TaxID=1070528 RepID=A0A6C0CYP4_9ZZZZ